MHDLKLFAQFKNVKSRSKSNTPPLVFLCVLNYATGTKSSKASCDCTWLHVCANLNLRIIQLIFTTKIPMLVYFGFWINSLWFHVKPLSIHCVKSVQIRSFFRSVFSCIQFEYSKIQTRNKSVLGHFSRSEFYMLKV